LSKEEKKTYNVTILARREITVYPKIGQEAKQIAVTYVAAGLPPSTIYIPKEKYTKDYEKKLIREDIEKRLAQRPEQITV